MARLVPYSRALQFVRTKLWDFWSCYIPAVPLVSPPALRKSLIMSVNEPAASKGPHRVDTYKGSSHSFPFRASPPPHRSLHRQYSGQTLLCARLSCPDARIQDSVLQNHYGLFFFAAGKPASLHLNGARQTKEHRGASFSELGSISVVQGSLFVYFEGRLTYAANHENGSPP